MRSILPLPLLLETIDECIWRMFDFMCVVVTVWGLWECSCRCEDSVFSIGVLEYVVCLCKGCVECSAFSLYCESRSCRCWCMGSVSVSSCKCCMFVSCVAGNLM